MNKYFFSIIIASLLLGFAACQKDEAASTKRQNISEADLQTARKITSFIEKMENPILLKDGSGSGETMDLDDARWNLEAALNYQFCSVPENITDIQVDSLEVILPVNGNLCDADDVANLYQQLCAAVAEQADIEDFQLMAVGVSLQEQKANEAIFRVYYFGSSMPIPTYLMFKEWEYFPARVRGAVRYCDGALDGEIIGSDIFIEMPRRVNAMLPAIASPYGPVYFTDLENLELATLRKLNPNWDGIDQFKKYNMYYVTYHTTMPDTISVCLPPSILNYYLRNIRDVIISDARMEGKSLIGISQLRGSRCINLVENHFDEYWHGDIQFGKANVKPNGPIM